MSLIQNAPLFQKTYALIKMFHKLRKSFEKGEKYSLGSLIEETLLALLMDIFDAGMNKQEWKIAAIDRANRHCEKSKVLIRLAHDFEQLRERGYLDLAEQLDAIGRMLHGWRRAT